MSKGQLNIDVLGTSFAIQANETDEYLNQIYNHYLNVLDQVRQTSKVSDPLKLAILTGILVTDELYKEEFSGQDSQELGRCRLVPCKNKTNYGQGRRTSKTACNLCGKQGNTHT